MTGIIYRVSIFTPPRRISDSIDLRPAELRLGIPYILTNVLPADELLGSQLQAMSSTLHMS